MRHRSILVGVICCSLWGFSDNLTYGQPGKAGRVGLGQFNDPSKGSKKISLKEFDRIVGIARAGTDQHVYAWTAANTVSSGISSNFAWHRSPYRFKPAPGVKASRIVATAMDSNNHVYTWYDNGKRSIGTTRDLDKYEEPRHYTIPGGRSPDNIVAIAISKGTAPSAFQPVVVYTWFDDGKVSIGSSRNLGLRTGRGKPWNAERAYTHARTRSSSGIVGMAVVTRPNAGGNHLPGNDHVFTWYQDGFATEGSVTDLDAYRGPFRYARHGVLQSVYPSPAPPINTPSASTPQGRLPTLSGDFSKGPSYFEAVEKLDINTASEDNTIAAGHDYFAVAFNASVLFYNRNGTDLTGANLVGNKANLNAMFAPFLRKSKSGTGPLDVNHYMNFPKSCEEYPETENYRFCVSSGVYDTRVEYDRIGKRFIIYAQVRNAVWTRIFSENPQDPILKDGKEYEPSIYRDPAGKFQNLNAADGKTARRLKVLAVSRTQDPRDGFFTYAFVQNNYRDWPWTAVNGNWLILSHQGQGQIDGPAATVMPLSDLRAGKKRPQFINYYPKDLNGAISAEPPRQHGDLPNHSLLVGKDSGEDNKDNVRKWRVYALPHSTAPYAKVAPTSTLINTDYVDMSDKVIPERFAYRDGYLHLVRHPVEKVTPPMNGKVKTFRKVQYYRVRLKLEGNHPKLSYDGMRQHTWGDSSPQFNTSHEEPTVQVNASGDACITFGQTGMHLHALHLAAPTKVIRVVWRHKNNTMPDAPVIWRAGGPHYVSHGTAIKALNAAVDPRDKKTFWGIHKFAGQDGNWDTFVGTHKPDLSP